jgi:hypothetical protein
MHHQNGLPFKEHYQTWRGAHTAPFKKTAFLNTASNHKLLHRIESVNCSKLEKKETKIQDDLQTRIFCGAAQMLYPHNKKIRVHTKSSLATALA